MKPVAIDGVGIVGLELVAGELEGDESVIGHVGIERLDDPVAIPPGVGAGLVELEAVGVGIAGQVEPVLRLTLAVVRAGQEPVNLRFHRLRRPIGLERGDLLGSRRQADQVEAQAAEQRRAVGLGSVGQPFGFEAQ